MYRYNYIVFFSNDDRLPKPVADGYQTLSLKDLEGVEGIHLVPYPLHYLPYFFRNLYYTLCNRSIKKYINLGIKRLFYPYVFNKKFLSNKPTCFLLIGGGRLTGDYLNYLKKTYPSCKIVWFFRDLMKLADRLCPEIVHNGNVDIRMSFDNGEAKKYGMEFCPEYSSIVDLSDHNNYPSCDVFFCGNAKDRYETLINYYQYLTNKGLLCNFYITNVPEEKQLKAEGLFYNQFMSYKEMLCRSFNSKCLLDINQKEAYGGYTSRFYEAIMYNRKLISDNPITKESCFYNGKDIIYVTKPEDISDDYLNSLNTVVNFQYNGEFSPLRMIERVETILQNKK